MANICSFEMRVKGEHNNIELFFAALTQKDNVYMGRGASAEIHYDRGGDTATIYGECKWSIVSALVDNAVSMRTNPNKWCFGDSVSADNLEFITLWEACEKYNVEMEVYSEESGCELQEHFSYLDGIQSEDCIPFYEYFLEDYNSKEEAEEDNETAFTDEEWELGKSGEVITRGGYKSWDFSI